MRVYVFGNEDTDLDNKAISVAKKLEKEMKDIEFVFLKPNEDLPFVDNQDVVLLDAVHGIDKPVLLEGQDLDKLVMPPRSSVHDFDLGFQLKYLQKLEKLGKVTIIGLPTQNTPDYFLIQSILRKLVAQDIQGS